MKLTKTVRAVLIFSTILCLVSGMVFASAAETGIYVGNSSFYKKGAQIAQWKMDCYVYYTANTSTSMTISKMAQIITNTGDCKVTQAMFRVVGADSNELTRDSYDMPDYGVAPGATKRLEVNWTNACSLSGMSNKYTKPTLTHFDSSYSDEWSAWLNAYWSGSGNNYTVDKNS